MRRITRQWAGVKVHGLHIGGFPHCVFAFLLLRDLSLRLRGCPSSTLPWVGYSFVLQLAQPILLRVTRSPGLPFLGWSLELPSQGVALLWLCPSPGHTTPGRPLVELSIPQGLSSLPWVFSSPVCLPSRLGMYRIVILPDNRIPDILLIETKPDTGYPAIFYSRIRISGQISG